MPYATLQILSYYLTLPFYSPKDCLMVRRGLTKNQMKTSKMRLAFLLPPIIPSLAMAVPPLFYQMCLGLRVYQSDCVNNPEVPCIRGENAIIATKIHLLYALLCTLIVIVFMVLLILSVYSQEKKSDKYLSKGESKKRDYTIDTAWQGVRYAGALLIPFTPPYVFFGCYLFRTPMSETSGLVWAYLSAILSPLLGFNNGKTFFELSYIF